MKTLAAAAITSNQSHIKAVDDLDLSMIKMKLMDDQDGLKWSNEQCTKIEIEYKRFLILLLLFPNESIVPTKQVDIFWHHHILDTRKYAQDCHDIFGYFVHHFPYFGMRGPEDKAELINAFNRTKQLYNETFGNSIFQENTTKVYSTDKDINFAACTSSSCDRGGSA